MVEIQVFEGDGVRPLPTTVDEATVILMPLLYPYRALNVDPSFIGHGGTSPLHEEAFAIAERECKFMKNEALCRDWLKTLDATGKTLPGLSGRELIPFAKYMVIGVITGINQKIRLDFSQWAASIPKNQISSRKKEDMAFQAYCLEAAKSHG